MADSFPRLISPSSPLPMHRGNEGILCGSERAPFYQSPVPSLNFHFPYYPQHHPAHCLLEVSMLWAREALWHSYISSQYHEAPTEILSNPECQDYHRLFCSGFHLANDEFIRHIGYLNPPWRKSRTACMNSLHKGCE